MYISKRIGLADFFARYWKTQLLILGVVSASTALYLEVLQHYVPVSVAAITGLSTVISVFVAFFTAQAYDRWWEARKIWGAFVNDSRSFGRMVMTLFRDPADDPEVSGFQRRLIRRHIAYLYAGKQHLRGESQQEALVYLSEEDAAHIRGAANPGDALLVLQGADIDAAERAGHIDGIRLLPLNDMLNRFSTSMGMAERIKLTVFPPYYEFLIRVSIWAVVLLIPCGLAAQIGYSAIPVAFLLAMILDLVFLAGRGLLDPFEGLPTDTPMSSIVRTIEINLLQQMGETDLPPPVEPIDGWYLL